MNEILEKLKTFKADIDYDIKSELYEGKEHQNCIRQSTQLAMAIGILQELGENNNIG